MISKQLCCLRWPSISLGIQCRLFSFQSNDFSRSIGCFLHSRSVYAVLTAKEGQKATASANSLEMVACFDGSCPNRSEWHNALHNLKHFTSNLFFISLSITLKKSKPDLKRIFKTILAQYFFLCKTASFISVIKLFLSPSTFPHF